MHFADRIYELFTQPTDTWLEVKEEPLTPRQLYLRYALPLAAIPPIARMVGLTVIGVSFLGVRYRSPLLNVLGYGIVSYVLSLVALYVAALVADTLAPYFGGRKNMDQALKLVIYSSIPYWIGGILLFIPGLAPLVTIISLYGCYLLFKGLPILMETPRANVPFYFLVLLAVAVILSFAAASIATALFLEGRMGIR